MAAKKAAVDLPIIYTKYKLSLIIKMFIEIFSQNIQNH